MRYEESRLNLRLSPQGFRKRRSPRFLRRCASKELELLTFAGDVSYIAFDDARRSWVVPVRGDAGAVFASGRMVDVIRKAIQPVQLAEARTLSEYDAYYLDRTRELPLPVLFVRIASGNPASE